MTTGVEAKELQQTAIGELPPSFIQSIPKSSRHLEKRLVLMVNALDARKVIV
ncbi:MAG: hypothetical protein ABSD39_03865 [Terriglobales bacterium]|jgi:hypothetical protein